MLQNRADPFGTIITTSARGAWMGNRGAIHDKKRRIVRSYSVTRWITCALEFKGRRRAIMSPGKYTELFFLDEATAFAAGHRPCQECRRDASLEFKKRWVEGNARWPTGRPAMVLTPASIINAFRAGYTPQMAIPS